MDEKTDDAIEAIDKLFSDTSVSQSETASRLKDLRDHIDVLLASLGDV